MEVQDSGFLTKAARRQKHICTTCTTIRTSQTGGFYYGYFSNAAKPLGGGLDQQIETFRREHPDTNLVIIDTLQKVRESGNEKCSYASDYESISKLKSLAEKLRI